MELLNTLPKYNLFGLEEQDYKKAKIVVIPIPYDVTLTYKSGARDGPHAIIDASRNLELYSYELGCDISKKVSVYTTDEMAPDLSSPEDMAKAIKKEIGIVLDDGKIPFMLGGDHSITIGALQAFKEHGKDIGIVHFDAHSDSRDQIFNSKYTHASVIARAGELYKSIVQVGLRNIDSDSAKKIGKNNIITMSEIHISKIGDIAKKIIKATGNDIYITIDLDVLDPSVMPSVGTPEPDGMTFNQVTEILRLLSEKKNLVGIDITELSPIPGLTHPNFTAAKLAYLTIGYFFAAKI